MTLNERPRPRFAWWVIPATIGGGFFLGTLLGVVSQLRMVITAEDLPTPAGWAAVELPQLRKGSPVPGFQGATVLGIWRPPGRPSELIMVSGRDFFRPPPIGQAFLEGIRQGAQKRTDNASKVVVKQLELRSIAGRTVAWLETTHGIGNARTPMHGRAAAFTIGNSLLHLQSYTTDVEESAGRAQFESYLGQLLELSPRRGSFDPGLAGRWAARLMMIGLIAGVGLASMVTRRRQRSYDDEAAALAARAAAQPPRPPERINQGG